MSDTTQAPSRAGELLCAVIEKHTPSAQDLELARALVMRYPHFRHGISIPSGVPENAAAENEYVCREIAAVIAANR